jgi:predicted site-specific integrase-resolvase
MNKPSEGTRFLSRRQQAERWAVHIRTVMRWGNEGRLPPEYMINGLPRRLENEIESFERGCVRARSTTT